LPLDLPIFYFARMLPAYRLAVMERLNERLDGRLVVIYGQPPAGNAVLVKPVEGGFRRVVHHNFWFRDTTLHAQIYRDVFRTYGAPSVVIAEESPRSITLPLLLRYARQQGAARILWGMFFSMKRSLDGLHLFDRYRLGLARRVEACICYSRRTRDHLAQAVPYERLFLAQNTLDTDTLFALRRRLETEGRAAVRRRLGLDGDRPVFVYMAQLIADKGPRALLEIFARLRQEKPSTLFVIGGGPQEEPMKRQVERLGLSDVHFLGSMPDFETSAPYLFAADALLMPGYVGLVINHAFALGLPIVAPNPPDHMVFHAPEIESLVHGHNGMLARWNDIDDFLAATQHVLAHRSALSAHAVAYAEEHLTLNGMIDGMVDAVRYAEANRP
jgi:glycosyltransferase involved in cell wall biosynthesis